MNLLHQRRNMLESLLRSAQELPENNPTKNLIVREVLLAILLEKRGDHDLCDETLMQLKFKLAIGLVE